MFSARPRPPWCCYGWAGDGAGAVAGDGAGDGDGAAAASSEPSVALSALPLAAGRAGGKGAGPARERLAGIRCGPGPGLRDALVTGSEAAGGAAAPAGERGELSPRLRGSGGGGPGRGAGCGGH